MKLDRNVNQNGRGKYALINLRTNKIEWGEVGSDDEFFVIKLKDRFSKGALKGYRQAISDFLKTAPHQDADTHASLSEFRSEVLEMEQRSGIDNPSCKIPD